MRTEPDRSRSTAAFFGFEAGYGFGFLNYCKAEFVADPDFSLNQGKVLMQAVKVPVKDWHGAERSRTPAAFFGFGADSDSKICRQTGFQGVFGVEVF